MLAMLAGSTLLQPVLPVVGALCNLVVPLCAAALAWRARISLAPAFRQHARLIAASAALYLWAWISAVLAPEPRLSMLFAAKYGAYGFVFVCMLIVLHRREPVRSTLRTAYAALVGLAVLGLVELVHPGGWFTYQRVLRGVYPRVASLLVWPNQLGVLTALALALGAALWRQGWLSLRGFVAPLPFLLAALACSGSRNGWFVCAALLVALVGMRVLRPLPAAAIGAAFALALLATPMAAARLGLEIGGTAAPAPDEATPPPKRGIAAPAAALEMRRAIWRAALVEIGRHPISGVGLEYFSNRIGPDIVKQPWINTHDLLLNVAAELGLVGLGLFVAWLILLWLSGDPRQPATTLPLLAIFLGQLVDCFTYDYAFMTSTALFAACYASLPPAEASTRLRQIPAAVAFQS